MSDIRIVVRGVPAAIRRLDRLSSRIARVTASDLRSGPRIAARFRALHRASWRAKESPYGSPWGVRLLRTGAMRAAATNWRALGSTISNSPGPSYARYHMWRRFQPDSGGLPGAWRSAARDIIARDLERMLRSL